MLYVKSEGATEGLIPRLRRSDAQDHILTVAHIQVELREELDLRKRILRIDTEERRVPGGPDTALTANLDAPAHSQPVCQAGDLFGGQVEIALPLQLQPQLVAERCLGDLDRTQA